MSRLLFFILLVVFMGSCKKDAPHGNTDNTPFYIKFKLNGVQKKYTYNATSLLAKPSVYACSLTAWGSAKTNPASVNIDLTDGSAFVTGKTYTEQVVNANGILTIQGSFTYKDDEGNIYFASGNTANTSISLKFTEMADDHFKGTFIATLLQVGKSPQTYVTITEGEFYVGRSL